MYQAINGANENTYFNTAIIFLFGGWCSIGTSLRKNTNKA
jgi:hypothetical protein